MTETSPESTKLSTDTTNVLPLLSKADAPVTVSLTIDKSVKTVAGWVIGLLIATVVLSVSAMIYADFARDAAIKAETELRLIDDWMMTHGVVKRDGKYVFKEETVNGE